MIAYCLMCNESVLGVVLDDEPRAKVFQKELQAQHEAKLIKEHGGRTSLFLEWWAKMHFHMQVRPVTP